MATRPEGFAESNGAPSLVAKVRAGGSARMHGTASSPNGPAAHKEAADGRSSSLVAAPFRKVLAGGSNAAALLPTFFRQRASTQLALGVSPGEMNL